MARQMEIPGSPRQHFENRTINDIHAILLAMPPQLVPRLRDVHDSAAFNALRLTVCDAMTQWYPEEIVRRALRVYWGSDGTVIQLDAARYARRTA